MILLYLANDYDGTAKTAILMPGQTEVCVNISITDDGIDEEEEDFCVTLTSNVPRVTFAPNSCQITVTITDSRRMLHLFQV